MRAFDEILAISAERHGSFEAAMEDTYPTDQNTPLAEVPDDRWLAAMTKAVFQAGFSWKVVENMWPGFEIAFKGFAIGPCAMMSEDWHHALCQDKSIIRNGQKIRTVQQNAEFIRKHSALHGGFGKMIADWPAADFAGLLELMKKEGSRLGGTSGQYMLRYMGRDGYILSRDVVARLVAEGVIDKAPTSKKAMAEVQGAFNTWAEQSGQPFATISRVLARSIG